MNQDPVTMAITSAYTELKANNKYFLNPYLVNNGLCDVIAETAGESTGNCIYSVWSMESCPTRKEHYLSFLSPGLDKEVVYSRLTRTNHDWVFSVETKLHYDVEVPNGVKYLDDIPIFARAIAWLIHDGEIAETVTWPMHRALTVLADISAAAVEGYVFREDTRVMGETNEKHVQKILCQQANLPQPLI